MYSSSRSEKCHGSKIVKHSSEFHSIEFENGRLSRLPPLRGKERLLTPMMALRSRNRSVLKYVTSQTKRHELSSVLDACDESPHSEPKVNSSLCPRPKSGTVHHHTTCLSHVAQTRIGEMDLQFVAQNHQELSTGYIN